MQKLILNHHPLLLLPQRAIYIETLQALLVSDVHLGKAETFQSYGVAVASQVNQASLTRLADLCQTYQPQSLWILGDLFHSFAAREEGVRQSWLDFLDRTQVTAHLGMGNHDRPLAASIDQFRLICHREGVMVDNLWFSHEPQAEVKGPSLCGHSHPCLRLGGRGDRLRLPCFHWQPAHNRLTLPAFGEFTGGYNIRLEVGEVAYVVAEDTVVEFRSRKTTVAGAIGAD
ncbi:MAG: ligase-associated DNA damage response endonuclease PdeM [Nodosilinea sp.]